MWRIRLSNFVKCGTRYSHTKNTKMWQTSAYISHRLSLCLTAYSLKCKRTPTVEKQQMTQWQSCNLWQRNYLKLNKLDWNRTVKQDPWHSWKTLCLWQDLHWSVGPRGAIQLCHNHAKFSNKTITKWPDSRITWQKPQRNSLHSFDVEFILVNVGPTASQKVFAQTVSPFPHFIAHSCHYTLWKRGPFGLQCVVSPSSVIILCSVTRSLYLSRSDESTSHNLFLSSEKVHSFWTSGWWKTQNYAPYCK